MQEHCLDQLFKLLQFSDVRISSARILNRQGGELKSELRVEIIYLEYPDFEIHIWK